MSESYEVLIDHEATRSNAAAIGKSIVDVLISEQLILPNENADCVLTGTGFPPGARVQEVYAYGEHELHYWEMLSNIGVQLRTDRYVNWHGFPVFEHSSCPACNACNERFPDGHPVMDSIYDCVASFINDDRLDNISCPSCAEKIRCDRWITVPDIGFCYLAVEFWNWPSFTAPGWKLSIIDLLNDRSGRNLVHSWGHM